MTLLLDTSLWIDFTRARSPAALKQRIAPCVLDPAPHLADPVRFALLRAARPEEAKLLEAQFDTLPLLPTPVDLWQRAIALGQACRRIGRTVLCLDLLVAAVALHHNAELVSFDTDAEVEALRDGLDSDKSERKESWLGSSPKNHHRQVCSSLGPMTVAIHPTC
jgi:predicted nucleic acid-binding protein